MIYDVTLMNTLQCIIIISPLNVPTLSEDESRLQYHGIENPRLFYAWGTGQLSTLIFFLNEV